jgi:uncharacterized protein YdeI (YjbR/CyaY-like superfamily)
MGRARLSMEIGETLYVETRKQWRSWLEKNHDKAAEIWLVYHYKDSGKPSIPYNDAVEEALCFGWIDSIYKKLDADGRAQRFTPRRPKSPMSPLNKERARVLIAAGKMTAAGLAVIDEDLDAPLVIAPDILRALKKDRTVWKNFQSFPEPYQRIRIGWIEGARKRPDELAKRLNHFLKMTAKNKMYGTMP